MILGKKWLENQYTIIYSKDNRLELRKSKRIRYSVKRWRKELRNVARPKVASVYAIKSMMKSVPICKVSLEDISKGFTNKA